MPPSWCAGTWLLYFLIQVNYLTTFAFSLVLGNPVTRDDDSITISCLAGEMRFCRIRPDSYTLSLRLVGEDHAYNLTVILRTTPLETQERPTSQAGTIDKLAPLASSIPPLPVHTPTDTWIIPPGVPFQVPCLHCQTPLEIGEYCQQHYGEGIMVLRQGPEASLQEHHWVSFLFLQTSRFQRPFLQQSESTRATRATSPASLMTSSPDLLTIPISQHACYRAPSPRLPADIPIGQLHIREGLGQIADRAPSSSRSRIPRPTTRYGGDDIRTLPNPLGGHPSGDHTNMESTWNSRRQRAVGNDGGPSLPVPPPTPTRSDWG